MPLRIVAYTNGASPVLSDNLARCINARTIHMCRSVRADGGHGGVLFDGDREWTREPKAVLQELRAADVIIQCDAPVPLAHQTLLASKPRMFLTSQEDGGCFLQVRYLSSHEEATPTYVPFPVPWWDDDYTPLPKDPAVSVCTVSTLLDERQCILLERARKAHIVVDRCEQGGGSGYSLMALAWGCEVLNGLAASRSARQIFRSLTATGADPPFLCASPETLDVLLSHRISSGPANLEAAGEENRKWIEAEWDFGRQWPLFWQPLIDRVITRVSVARSHVPRSTPVSAIIVTRNEGGYLQRTVESLHRTMSSKDEIIVVDDQSTDGSTEQLEQLYDGVRVLRSPLRLGVAGARNLGVEHANGDVIVFSDAHIEVPSDWIAPVVEALSSPDAGAVSAGLHSLHHRLGKGVCGGRWCAGTGDLLKWQWLPSRNAEPYPVPLLSGGFLAMRRDVYRRTGGFDAGMWMYGVEDTELSVRLWTRGYQCLAVPRVLVAHRFNRPARAPVCDYKSNSEIALHNKLRLAVLHFGSDRLTRVVEPLARNRQFPAAFARLSEGDAWVRRREYQASRQYDDDWYFRRFDMPL